MKKYVDPNSLTALFGETDELIKILTASLATARKNLREEHA